MLELQAALGGRRVALGYGAPCPLPTLLGPGLPLSWHAQKGRQEYSGHWTSTVLPALGSHLLGASGPPL